MACLLEAARNRKEVPRLRRVVDVDPGSQKPSARSGGAYPSLLGTARAPYLLMLVCWSTACVNGSVAIPHSS
jgi:hypothetical protein